VAKFESSRTIFLSCGPDNFPPLFYKQAVKSIAVPLALLYTQLMSVGAVPHQWKAAIVVPAFNHFTARPEKYNT